MKKTLLILLSMLALAQACRYEEGPAVSLTTVRNRLMGTWKVSGFECEGLDSLQYYQDSCGCEVQFIDHKDYDGHDGVLFTNCHNSKYYTTFAARFAFYDNKNFISISFAEHPLSYVDVYRNYGPILMDCNWEILRLTKKELKISSDIEGRKYVLTFEKK